MKVWEKSHKLTLEVYSTTKVFPREEIYGLASQMRRSSASIPANIAEGCGRRSKADFAHFLQIAMGSACELEYQLLLSKDLGYIAEDNHLSLESQTIEIKKMLVSYLQKLMADN